MNFGFHECRFCNTRFIHEAHFKKHKCELMVRDEFVRTHPDGRFGFRIYKSWINIRGYQTPKRLTFIESRYYNTIVKFTEFYRETMLPDVDDYISFVVEDNLLPAMWSNSTIYEQYLVSFDDRVTPLKQAELTFTHLENLARQLEMEPVEVFDYIEVSELVKLIQCRRLSPWVLLCSKRFLRYIRECDASVRPALEAMVDPDIWDSKFHRWPKSLATIKELTKELGI